MKTVSKALRCDLHTHTNYSFDSTYTMLQYIQSALKLGVDVLCFTDHIDVNKHYDTFVDFQFERRKEEFAKMKDTYGDKIKLLYGFEIGEPHLHPEVMEVVYAQSPDMIIGSVHHPLDYLGIDEWLSHRDYERYYNECVRQMVEHGGFDVLGHADMPAKYHDDYVEDIDYISETLRLCVQNGIVPEINTSSLRSGCSYTMPSLNAIACYAQHGGKWVTINSDSHNPTTVCADFDETRAKLPDGVSLCYFENRKIVKL